MAQPHRREPLSRERILATALALARRDGPDALSMRRIATELDVWPMSLYRHFRDKDELLDALAGEAAHEISAPAGASWREDLEALLRQARYAFAAHPAGVRLHREPSLREAGLAVLARAGLPDAESGAAWGALVAFAAGAAAVEADSMAFEYGLGLLLDALSYKSGSG